MRTTQFLRDCKDELIAEAHRCWPWMKAAMQRGMPSGILTHDLDDIIQMLLDGNAQLWSTEDGCIVTCVTTFPKTRIVQIWLMGGDFEQVVSEHEAALVDWATSIGACLLYVQGRKGWLRRLKDRGYQQNQVILSLELTNGEHDERPSDGPPATDP